VIRRLLLLLLAFCLAAPAVAAPLHCASAPKAAGHHAVAVDHHGGAKNGEQPPASGSRQHDCIGCIAPYAGPARISERPFAPALALKMEGDRAVPLSATGPDTPPPRA